MKKNIWVWIAIVFGTLTACAPVRYAARLKYKFPVGIPKQLRGDDLIKLWAMNAGLSRYGKSRGLWKRDDSSVKILVSEKDKYGINFQASTELIHDSVTTNVTFSNGRFVLTASLPQVCPRVYRTMRIYKSSWKQRMHAGYWLLGIPIALGASFAGAFYHDGITHGVSQANLRRNPYYTGGPSREDIMLPGHITIGITGALTGWLIAELIRGYHPRHEELGEAGSKYEFKLAKCEGEEYIEPIIKRLTLKFGSGTIYFDVDPSTKKINRSAIQYTVDPLVRTKFGYRIQGEMKSSRALSGIVKQLSQILGQGKVNTNARIELDIHVNYYNSKYDSKEKTIATIEHYYDTVKDKNVTNKLVEMALLVGLNKKPKFGLTLISSNSMKIGGTSVTAAAKLGCFLLEGKYITSKLILKYPKHIVDCSTTKTARACIKSCEFSISKSRLSLYNGHSVSLNPTIMALPGGNVSLLFSIPKNELIASLSELSKLSSKVKYHKAILSKGKIHIELNSGTFANKKNYTFNVRWDDKSDVLRLLSKIHVELAENICKSIIKELRKQAVENNDKETIIVRNVLTRYQQIIKFLKSKYCSLNGSNHKVCCILRAGKRKAYLIAQKVIKIAKEEFKKAEIERKREKAIKDREARLKARQARLDAIEERKWQKKQDRRQKKLRKKCKRLCRPYKNRGNRYIRLAYARAYLPCVNRYLRYPPGTAGRVCNKLAHRYCIRMCMDDD